MNEQVLSYLLGILQFLCTADALESLVCVVRAEIACLTILAITEQDELKSVEAQDTLVLNLRRIGKIAEQRSTAQRPRVDVWVYVEAVSRTQQESLALLPLRTCLLESSASLVNITLCDLTCREITQSCLQLHYCISQIGIGRHYHFVYIVLQNSLQLCLLLRCQGTGTYLSVCCVERTYQLVARTYSSLSVSGILIDITTTAAIVVITIAAR